MRLNDIKKNMHNETIGLMEYIQTMHLYYGVLFDYADYIRQTDIEKIVIAKGDVVFTFRGGIRMFANPIDYRQAPMEALCFSGDSYNFSAYEKGEFNILSSFLKDGMTMLDIGANIGWFSLQLANRFPNADILSFEPLPTAYELLVRNVLLNKFDNVRTYNSGFMDKAGVIPFYVFSGQGTNASTVNLMEVEEGTKQINCQVYKLDEFIRKPVDFIKCDVEGAEMSVFKGAEEILRRDKPIIYTEVCKDWAEKFDWDLNDLAKYLHDLGYTGFVVRNGKLMDITMLNAIEETNFIFLNRERNK